jgi:hypothetical protein
VLPYRVLVFVAGAGAKSPSAGDEQDVVSTEEEVLQWDCEQVMIHQQLRAWRTANSLCLTGLQVAHGSEIDSLRRNVPVPSPFVVIRAAHSCCSSENVDGELLLALTDESLLEDFKMTRLQQTRLRVKINKLVGGESAAPS